MPRLRRAVLYWSTGAAALVLLAVIAGAWLVHPDRYRRTLEVAASRALGMEVHVGGRLGFGWLPGPHLDLEDVRIVGERAGIVASVPRATVGISLLPLLHGQLRLSRLELVRPQLEFVRRAGGPPLAARFDKPLALLRELDGAELAVSEGALRISEPAPGESLEALGIRMSVKHLRLASAGGSPRWRDLSARAELSCASFTAHGVSGSAFEATIVAKHGVFECAPIRLRIFGGRATASLRADGSGTVPLERVHCSVEHFRVEQLLALARRKASASGDMDFSADLSLTGASRTDMVRSASGVFALKGEHLTIAGSDIDRAIARFDSGQNFSLIDAGAVFLAGPIGLGVTRGYDFAGFLIGTGGRSQVDVLVSKWSLEYGIAQAQDVALATKKNRLALQGRLDFVHEQFAGVTMAVVDHGGCARARQTIRGTFAKPVVDRPHVLSAVSAPVVGLLQKVRRLLPEKPCEPFYSGSVAPPR